MSQDTTPYAVRHALDVDQALVEHARLVHWVVHRQWLGDLSYTAAVQAGRLALWRAARGYDPRRGVAFSSYAVPAIRRAIWRAVAEAQRPAWEQLWAQPPQTTPDPELVVSARLVAAAVRRLVAQLPVRLRSVIVAHYGLAQAQPRASPPSARLWA